MASTVAELEIAKLQSLTGLSTTNLTDLRWAYYSAASGLTPLKQYSLSDHMKAKYGASVAAGSLTDMEQAYMRFRGASGSSYDDLAYSYWTSFGPI